MLPEFSAGKARQTHTAHTVMWFRFSSDEPLRRNTPFWRQANVSGQQVNHDLHLLDVSTTQGENPAEGRSPEDPGFGSGFTAHSLRGLR